MLCISDFLFPFSSIFSLIYSLSSYSTIFAHQFPHSVSSSLFLSYQSIYYSTDTTNSIPTLQSHFSYHSARYFSTNEPKFQDWCRLYPTSISADFELHNFDGYFLFISHYSWVCRWSIILYYGYLIMYGNFRLSSNPFRF
jgi:hypothetical protein